ncbi:deoxyribonuclease V [Variovorax boronicumulans]|nr:deoxyribonuclease V [Variovorax boronicumulans]
MDVAYAGVTAVAAGVLLKDWDATMPTREVVVQIPHVEEYVSGEFFRRELPCIETVLRELGETPDCVVVDGYVTLGDPPRDGLGALLWNKLGRTVVVVGVAKSRYIGASENSALRRGGSNRPLFITAAGMTIDEAKQRVLSMAGKHRLPDMLKYVDGLARRAA